MYKIFDAHTHVYPEKIAEKAIANLGGFYNYEVEKSGTFDDLCACSAENGVCGFLLLTVATNARQVPKINDYAALCLKTAKERGFSSAAFGGIHQDMTDSEKEAEVTRCKEMGISGFKIHPDIQEVYIDDRSMYPFYEMLCANDLPITFHMGDCRAQYPFSHPARLLRILNDFPRLRVIAAHFGGYTVWDEAVELLAGREGLKFDSSSSLSYMATEKAEKIIGKLGAENIMFGTDSPSLGIEGELERFRRLSLTGKEKEIILWNNAAEFLKI